MHWEVYLFNQTNTKKTNIPCQLGHIRHTKMTQGLRTPMLSSPKQQQGGKKNLKLITDYVVENPERRLRLICGVSVRLVVSTRQHLNLELAELPAIGCHQLIAVELPTTDCTAANSSKATHH